MNIEELQKQIADFEQQAAEAEKRVDECKTQIAPLKARRNELRAELAEIEQQLETILKARAKALADEAMADVFERDAAHQAVEENTGTLNARQERKRDLELSIGELDERIRSLAKVATKYEEKRFNSVTNMRQRQAFVVEEEAKSMREQLRQVETRLRNAQNAYTNASMQASRFTSANDSSRGFDAFAKDLCN